MSFDWQTEEDNDWDDQAWQEQPETAVSPKPPWRTIVLVLVLLSMAGGVIYQQIGRRLEETTSAVEEDVFVTHNLLSRAAAKQDGELGRAVLSGRDPGWSQVQSSLLDQGLFYENPTFGLSLANKEVAYEPLFREDERFLDLVLDPDLNGAELSYTQEYLAFTKVGVQTVTLRQTAVYRRGETRWLLAPPLDDFWGEWITEESNTITFVYPERDTAVLEQLIPALSELLAETCAASPELACTPSIQLRFETDPESLLNAADPAEVYQANLRLNLPAPTLVGVPINEDGYEALLYAYGTKMVSGLIAEAMAYECCSHAPLFQALMIYQLSELGLAEWPVTQETHLTLATSGVHAELMFPYWGSANFADLNDEDNVQLFGFVDFLLKQYVPEQTPLGLMSRMEAIRTFRAWLDDLRGADQAFGEIEMLSRDWWFYALTQSEITAVSNQPIALPAQDLQVGCLNMGNDFDENSHMTLYRYNLGQESWQEELAFEGLGFFNPLPKDDGVVLQLIETSENQFWQTLLWQENRSTELMNLADIYSISLGQMDPNGRFLLSYFGTDQMEGLPEPLLIDMASCQSGSCTSTPITQTPYWSPDSQWMLLTDAHIFESSQYMVDGRVISLNAGNALNDGPLWLRQTMAEPETAVSLGQGSAPFWIDNKQFGYIRTMADTTQPFAQELIVASTDQTEPQVILTTEELADIVPGQRVSNPLLMQYAIAHPADPNSLLLMIGTQASNSYLLLLDRQSGELTLLFTLDVSRGEHSLGFSPDGRYLVATGALWQAGSQGQENMLFGAMHLYDLATGEHQQILVNNEVFFPAFTFDWSQDGSWLAFTRDENVIGLVAPDYDYQQMILHDQGNCISLAWINSVVDN